MRQVSLVAFYGPKTDPLAGLLGEIRSQAEQAFGASYTAYHADQIHGTVVGMERLVDPEDAESIVDDRPGRMQRIQLRSGQDVLVEAPTRSETEQIRDMVGLDRADQVVWSNANLFARSGLRSRMRFRSISDVLKTQLPVRIQFGGYSPGDDAFLSCDQPRFERSLFVHRSSGNLVLIGWPNGNDLLDLRVAFERRCSIAHKYDEDNDCYLVLGAVRLEQGITEEQIAVFENSLRGWLRRQPTHVSLREATLGFAGYADRTMPTATTDYLPLSEGSEDAIRSLYRS